MLLLLLLADMAGRGVLAQGGGPEAGDPCQAYGNLTDASRAVHFRAPPSAPLLCDRFLRPGWFRFPETRMSTRCQPRFACGTEGALWLRGREPLPEEGVVHRTACAGLQPASPHCCDVSLPLQVRNCGRFLVYRLSRPPGCPMAYCTGKGDNCTGKGDNCTGKGDNSSASSAGGLPGTETVAAVGIYVSLPFTPYL